MARTARTNTAVYVIYMRCETTKLPITFYLLCEVKPRSEYIAGCDSSNACGRKALVQVHMHFTSSSTCVDAIYVPSKKLIYFHFNCIAYATEAVAERRNKSGALCGDLRGAITRSSVYSTYKVRRLCSSDVRR